MPLDELLRVFDAERNPYMEWHDGPSLQEVDEAMKSLLPREREAASALVAERLRQGYDPYLGRAAELLGTDECRQALAETLRSATTPGTAANVARNLLTMGKSAEAIDTLRAIIANPSLGWSTRIDTLVDLKIALASAAGCRPLSDFITPEFAAVIFAALSDDEYLVRYHAAEALLRAAGDNRPLTEHVPLFKYICGQHPLNGAPDEADRAGFREAAAILQAMLKI